MTLPAFCTPRLLLRAAADPDLDALWSLWNDPDVRRYLFDDVAVTRERAHEVFDDVRTREAEGLGLWMIVRRGSAEPIGCVGLRRITSGTGYDPRLIGSVEPIVALHPTVWRRGYAAEAVEAVLRHGFATLGLPHIVAVTDVPNGASDRLLRRLGFSVTGEFDGPRYRARSYRREAASGDREPGPRDDRVLPQ